MKCVNNNGFMLHVNNKVVYSHWLKSNDYFHTHTTPAFVIFPLRMEFTDLLSNPSTYPSIYSSISLSARQTKFQVNYIQKIIVFTTEVSSHKPDQKHSKSNSHTLALLIMPFQLNRTTITMNM